MYNWNTEILIHEILLEFLATFYRCNMPDTLHWMAKGRYYKVDFVTFSILKLGMDDRGGFNKIHEKRIFTDRKIAFMYSCRWPRPAVLSFTTGHSSFAECLRHSAKAILYSAKALPSVTLDKERSANCTSATASLPSTFCRALGKEKSPSRCLVTVTDPLPSVFFGTRQRGQFCRVSAITALGKDGSSGPHRQSQCQELP
jgi:hypothetical protein